MCACGAKLPPWRAFKRCYGVTPSDVRDAIKAADVTMATSITIEDSQVR
jgi:AraC-like DNA-binding protein